MPRVLLLNKPFGALCQFSVEPGRACLADFVKVPDVYPAGRLDADSEGLVVLTDDGRLQQRISHPRHKLAKVYWVQVEGEPSQEAVAMLCGGIELSDGKTLPCKARLVAEPDGLWPRHPPIRARKAIPASWLEMVLVEGRNRQVRRMTAAAGHPTLRLIRAAIGPWHLDGLVPGRWREGSVNQL